MQLIIVFSLLVGFLLSVNLLEARRLVVRYVRGGRRVVEVLEAGPRRASFLARLIELLPEEGSVSGSYTSSRRSPSEN